jgi:hypothetical protein
VTVEVLDANNLLVTSDNTDQVAVALAQNPSGATLGGTTSVIVSGGIATFSNLSVHLAGTGYTLGASSGTLAPATSAGFNVTTATVLEDFEHGLGLYRSTSFSTYRVSASAAHDGSYGLDMSSSYGWIYRNDPAAQVRQGETLSVWVQAPNFAVGRAYFGFGASASGTLSVVMAADTNQLIIQDNAGYGLRGQVAVSQSYLPSHWYRLEVAWGIGGSITARLYDSNGTALLKTVQATDNSITSGGIAFLATSYDKYFDTVTVTNTVSPHVLGAPTKAPVTGPAFFAQPGSSSWPVPELAISVLPSTAGPVILLARQSGNAVSFVTEPDGVAKWERHGSEAIDWTSTSQERLLTEYFANLEVLG